MSDYGMSKDDLAALLEWQEGRCNGCERKFTRRRVACIDHDHRTGKVRGLLCSNCNTLLGVVHDDGGLLLGLFDHLRCPPASEALDGPRFHKDAPPSKEQ